jgi:hypothetical protein
MADVFSASPSISFSAPFFDIPEGEFQFFDLDRTIPTVDGPPTTARVDECSSEFPSTPILSNCRPRYSEFAGSLAPRDCDPATLPLETAIRPCVPELMIFCGGKIVGEPV